MMKTIIFLCFTVALGSAVKHSLQYFYTGVTGIDFPEFTSVGQVDEEQFYYYDKNLGKSIPKTEWIKQVVGYEAGYWEREKQNMVAAQETFKANIDTAMKRFNQTTGVHTVQWMYGCELDDDGTTRGYRQDGYDGEDFIILDLKTLTWTAPVPQAVITKHKWEVTLGGAPAKQYKNYLENECIEWLKKYVEYGRDTLERKVPPEVSMFRKDSSSPVVCHATGFFPKEVMISWQKNGEDVEEEVELRETLRNQDGSFQKRSVLNVSPEELNTGQYTCVIQHAALDKEMVLKVEDRRILSGGGVMVGVIIGVAVVVLLLVIIGCVGVFIWKKKSGFKPLSQTPSEADSASNSSKHSSESLSVSVLVESEGRK